MIKYPGKSNLREERLICAHGLRVQLTLWGNNDNEFEKVGNLASAGRNRRVMDAFAQTGFSFSFCPRS